MRLYLSVILYLSGINLMHAQQDAHHDSWIQIAFEYGTASQTDHYQAQWVSGEGSSRLQHQLSYRYGLMHYSMSPKLYISLMENDLSVSISPNFVIQGINLTRDLANG